MKNPAFIRFLVALLLAASLTRLSAQSVPGLINYQGRLLDAQGVPVATADYELRFTLFSTATGGTAVWGPQVFDGATGAGHGAKVPAAQGWFNVILGPVDTTGRAITAAFAAPDRYLEIQIGTNAPIAPRQRLLSAPFALMAGQVPDGSITTAKLAAGAVGAAQLASGTVAFVPRNIQVFTSSGTWTKPADVSTVYVKVIGRGGNGGDANDSRPRGGGGGGGYAEGFITVTGNIPITIGATNSFVGASIIQATSGTNASGQTGGTGGLGSGGVINLRGGAGQNVSTTVNGTGGMGGASALGAGGASGALINGTDYVAAGNGASFGGGGGGATNEPRNGGIGDPGAVIVYY